jgi:hypothetical protein
MKYIFETLAAILYYIGKWVLLGLVGFTIGYLATKYGWF